MPITISAAGSYTVVQGETYIISPGVSGTVTFNAPTGSGTIDFSVESNQSATGNLTVNLNSTSAGMTMNPTVSVADGVDAGRVSFQAVGNNFGNLSYDIGDGAKIGAINSADGSLIGTNYAEVKTTITAGDNATIGSILGGTAASNVTLGDNVNITGGINGTYGGFTMETGSGFNYSGAEMNFRYSKADVSIDIGDNSNLHSQNVYMAESYINYSFSIGANSSAGNVEMGGGFGNHTVNVGNDTTIGHLLIGGSGPGIQQTVNLGDNVNTGDISIGGSGTAASPMVITINAGNGTHIGGTQFTAGNIGLGGTYIVRDITFGDDVTVEGLLGMGGSAGTNTVVIGDNYTQNGYFTGSLTGTETVTIGNNWKFSSTFDLQAGDDSLKLGYSDRNSGSYISGGANTDKLTLVIPPEFEDEFYEAATGAGWTLLPGGEWSPNGKTLNWRGKAFIGWESAEAVPCFARGTLISTARGNISIENLRCGDLILTKDNGHQPIRWIGSKIVGAATLERKPKLRPIRINKGALGADNPSQDLLVSPEHRILVRSTIARHMFGSDEVLVAAKLLLSIDGVDIAHDKDEVEYFHILLDTHEVIYSNGAETESLYPGIEALRAVGSAAAEEIFEIFPEFRADCHIAMPARQFCSGQAGKALALRHAQTAKPIVA